MRQNFKIYASEQGKILSPRSVRISSSGAGGISCETDKIYALGRGQISSKALAAFLLAAACHLGATDLFVAAQTPLLNKAGGKEIAKLHVGAKLQVLKDGKDYVQVRYAGFVPEGSNVSYARLGILEQDLQAQNAKSLKTLKTVKDDYDNEWANVTIDGYVAKLAVTDDAAKIYDAGEDLFKERCGSCHALHGYDEFNVNVWPSVVETMIQNSGLQPDEYETLVRFLQSKAPIE